jgi:hypothetical protein
MCCIVKKNTENTENNDTENKDIEYLSNENSPYTFEDLSSDSALTSSWSSSCSLDNFPQNQTLSARQQQELTESLHRIKKYNQRLMRRQYQCYGDVFQVID